METNRLSEFLDIFDNNKIMIDERQGVNVDFFIRDLVKIYKNPSIYIWNESCDHLKEICRSKDLVIKGEYNGDVYAKELISDHVYTAKHLFNVSLDSKFNIFRDGTGTKVDWYDYGIIILIEPLPSGLCVDYDGMITIKSRSHVYKQLKYKVGFTKTEYYNL